MALLHASITYKGKTLVMELPQDYLKIYEELNSIGSRKALERIPLTDNEGDAIRVKLYADSDIGNHLLHLLGKNSTLADANTAAFAVLNADEDIRQELEQNLLNDQYANTVEMLRDIISEHDGMTMKKEGNRMNEWERLHRQAERCKEAYPPGTRVLLLHMGEDPRPVEDHMRGTVRFVDDMGTMHCAFDNGRILGLIPGEDRFRKLTDAELAEEQESKLVEDAGPVMGM